MDSKREDFYRELMAEFRIEAAEHRDSFCTCLLDLEKERSRDKISGLVEVMFREMHSLKGAARAVNLGLIEQLCQAVEGVMALLKQQKILFTNSLADVFHASVNLLDSLLSDPEPEKMNLKQEQVKNMVRTLHFASTGSAGNTGKTDFQATKIDLKEKMDESNNSSVSEITISPSKDSPLASADKSGGKETVRIHKEKLETILLQAEELITLKATLKNLSSEFNSYLDAYRAFQKLSGNRGDGSDYGQGEADDIPGSEKPAEGSQELHIRQKKLTSEINGVSRFFGRTIDDLLIDIRKTLLMPFSSILDHFPKAIRDLAKDLKKEVHFQLIGSDVEIDRRILEELKSPLLHLVRNCVDHGIELPALRAERGKNPEGSLSMQIQQTENRQVEIKVCDDGAGMSPDTLAAVAVKKGLIAEDMLHTMSDAEKLRLIFISGLSTSSYITNISGRGLGMAIVAEKVTELGGQYQIESTEGKGTCITLTVPVTLATFRGIQIRVADKELMIPINSIEKVLRIKPGDTMRVKNQESFMIGGKVIAMVYLAEALGIPRPRKSQRSKDYFTALLLSSGQRKVVFIVDEIVGEQEGIVKPLGPQLVHLRNIAGAIVLGDGRLIPVINTTELLDYSNPEEGIALQEHVDLLLEDQVVRNQKILIAEDSLTSRSLLKNILEGAGFKVKTAVDGAEAFSYLLNEEFDLLVSDIEMPRMNGFELTSRIRSEDRLSSLPVILITSLESAEDRQKGLEAGASAYFIKSSFNQTNLISVIHRLL